ncbi:hypothetical protein KY348_07810 [Candidatus Woesearchaeota archaeon]|nr:hypothetical protein [Candidatus Woesearchaeota archaeon]
MIEISLEQALETIKPLIFFLLGMVVYSIFIFHFYRFIARKDIFKLNLAQYNRLKHPFFAKVYHVILYIIEYIILFPLFATFWFAILTVLLTFLAKEPVVKHILMMSVAIVGAIRFTAYYKEALSKDLAKMLPFALLGVYVIESAYFSFTNSWELIKTIPSEINLILYYLLFLIALEFVLRIFYTIFAKSSSKEDETQG